MPPAASIPLAALFFGALRPDLRDARTPFRSSPGSSSATWSTTTPTTTCTTTRRRPSSASSCASSTCATTSRTTTTASASPRRSGTWSSGRCRGSAGRAAGRPQATPPSLPDAAATRPGSRAPPLQHRDHVLGREPRHRRRASCVVAEPMCGSSTQRGASSSVRRDLGLVLVDVEAGGAERALAQSAAASAASSTSGPREVLTRTPSGPISSSSAAPIRCWVSGPAGRVDADHVGGLAAARRSSSRSGAERRLGLGLRRAAPRRRPRRRARGPAPRSGGRSGPGRRRRPSPRAARGRGRRPGPSPASGPARRSRSASLIRRPAASVSARASSAVASVRTPGVLVTTIAALAAGVEVDVVVADGEVGDDLAARRPRRRAARRPPAPLGSATSAAAPGRQLQQLARGRPSSPPSRSSIALARAARGRPAAAPGQITTT